MNRPRKPSNLAGGQPILGELVAVIDETSPEMGPGVYYVLTTAVMLDPVAVAAELGSLFDDVPGRKRGFHWHKEGPAARQVLLLHLADDLHAEGIEHLIIESVDEVTNSRDRTSLLTHFEDQGGVPFQYNWRSKNEQLLWVADAINGALHDYYFHSNPAWFLEFCKAGVLSGEPTYAA